MDLPVLPAWSSSRGLGELRRPQHHVGRSLVGPAGNVFRFPLLPHAHFPRRPRNAVSSQPKRRRPTRRPLARPLTTRERVHEILEGACIRSPLLFCILSLFPLSDLPDFRSPTRGLQTLR